MYKALNDLLVSLYKTAKLIMPLNIILLIWTVCFYLARLGAANLPKPSYQHLDLGTIISGAGLLGICAFSILIGLFGLFIPAIIERKAREVMGLMIDGKIREVEAESQARSFAILGYVLGENSLNSDFSILDEERLREAINYCEKAYAILKRTGKPVEFTVLNNFLEYSCLLPEKTRSRFFLEEAWRLGVAAEEHNTPNLLLTFARTLLTFSADPSELERASTLVNNLLDDPRLSGKQKREVEQLAKICAAKNLGTSR